MNAGGLRLVIMDEGEGINQVFHSGCGAQGCLPGLKVGGQCTASFIRDNRSAYLKMMDD